MTTAQNRQQADPWWTGSFHHPFITELAAGTLPLAIFKRYLLQDRYYLQHFGQIHQAAAEMTDDPHIRALLTDSGDILITGEEAVRATFFRALGITQQEIDQTPIAPTAYFYVAHMQAQLAGGNVLPVIAGLLPCSWLYLEIGQRLIAQGSPNPLYQQWIETYATDTLADSVADYRAVLDDQPVPATMQLAIDQAFLISSICEYNFWEMAYQDEQWPLAAAQTVVAHG